jgi:copper chaperone CopZ
MPNHIKSQSTFFITGLTCKKCAAKVKTALAEQNIIAEISDDLTKISLNTNQINTISLNEALKKVGNYIIGESVLMPQTAGINVNSPTKTVKNSANSDQSVGFFTTYKPLILVFAYILLVSLVIEIAAGAFQLHRFMPNFMAGFFLVFSFFKLLDLAGFARSYAMYDVLAKRFPIYGYIYPFIELALAAAYLLAPSHALTSTLTLIVMLVSLIGVVQAVLSRQKIQCACLGTGFNLPMSTVTIIEDVLMAGMAAWMLI